MVKSEDQANPFSDILKNIFDNPNRNEYIVNHKIIFEKLFNSINTWKLFLAHIR